MLSKELQKDIEEGYQEYEDKEGLVTIEYSVKRNDIKDIFTFVDEQMYGACWYAMECDTCQSDYGLEYVHLSIEKEEYVNEFCSNVIQKSK